MQPICYHLNPMELSLSSFFRNIIFPEVLYMKNENFDTWLAIGLNILHYRKEQGMTQMQLAEKCGLSRNHIQRIESAAKSCSLDTLIDIAEALGIPLKKLFEFKD